jgi:hypothetical protein
MSLTDTLSKQAGPLPIGAWVLVIGGGLGIAFYTNRGTRSAPVEEQISTGTDPGVGMGAGTPGFIPVAPPAPTGPTQYADNDQWASAAVRYLVGALHNPTIASMAIRKYVDGQSWSAAEDKMIQAAIKELGPPPLIPIGGGTTPAPTTPIPPTPTKTAPGIWVTTQKASPTTMSLQALSKRFYGYYAGWGTILSANYQGVRRPDGSIGMVPMSGVLKPGWRIWIPGGRYAPP